MSLEATSLFVSLIPGAIGFVLVVYGRKQHRWPQLVAGLLFLAYPYFMTTLLSMVVTGVAIGFALWYALRLG